jgi:urease accessory protein
MPTTRAKARTLLRSSSGKCGPKPVPTPRESVRTSSPCIEEGALYRLMIWLSSAYPVGAFSYSTGIEWSTEVGDVKDAETLRCWIEAMLADGAGMSDGVFFSQAHRAIACGDDAALADVAELAAAFVPTRERYGETMALGRAFLEVTSAAWPCDALGRLQKIWRGPFAYPIAVAAACAGHRIPLALALHGFLTAVASNWVSAGTRLIPLGHTDGQRVLHALEPAITASMERAIAARLDDVGTATFRADLASIRHETQHTRLFRS